MMHQGFKIPEEMISIVKTLFALSDNYTNILSLKLGYQILKELQLSEEDVLDVRYRVYFNRSLTWKLIFLSKN
jgi:hypothetical protein